MTGQDALKNNGSRECPARQPNSLALATPLLARMLLAASMFCGGLRELEVTRDRAL
jgi:hypothetical protein